MRRKFSVIYSRGNHLRASCTGIRGQWPVADGSDGRNDARKQEKNYVIFEPPHVQSIPTEEVIMSPSKLSRYSHSQERARTRSFGFFHRGPRRKVVCFAIILNLLLLPYAGTDAQINA
jgi:hypothetical protein